MAEIFKSDPRVLFGLMNEPQQRDAEAWVGIEQLALDAIRRTGARNLVLASGIGWDGAHDFATVNGAAFGHLHDPARHIVVEVHQYFDRDSSGTHDDCTSPDAAVARLAGFTTWARAAHRHAVLGEFGVSRKPECLAVLNSVMSFLAANGDVWRGWTYWAAGPLWGNYMFTLEPDHGSDRPQMRVLAPFLRRVGVPPAPFPRSP